MFRKLALILAVTPALWLSQAFALGLGDIDVQSALNQRFNASIPLMDVSADEVETLQIGLASNESYASNGLDRSDYLSTLSFKVQTDNGAPRIVITSKQIAREPTLNLLVDVLSHSGRMKKQYTILLDPPNYALDKFTPVAEPVTEAPPPVVTPTPPPKKSPSAEPTPPKETTHKGSYGPVAAGETLWRVAEQVRHDPKITMDQMQLALYKANPHAFEDGRIGKLMKGVTLTVPKDAAVRAVNADVARRQIQQLRAGRSAAASKPVAPRAETPAAKAEQPVAAPTLAPEPPKTVAPPKPAEPTPTPAPVSPPAPAKPPAPSHPAAAPPPAAAATPPAVAPATASHVMAAAPASAVVSSEPTVKPASAEVASGAMTATESASVPATEVASTALTETASVIHSEPIAPVKPYIPPPVMPTTDTSTPLMEEWGDTVKMAGGAAVLLGLVGYLMLSRKKQPPQRMTQTKAPSKFSLPKFDWQFWKKKADALEKPANVKPVKVPAVEPKAFDEEAFEREYAASAKAASAPTAARAVTAAAAPAPARKTGLPPNDTMQLPNFDSTQIFDAPPAVVHSINTDQVDFDVTGKFEAETLKIDLNNNDPLAEADFHLAYGLYDEAALQLKQAAQKEPKRTDIPLKLAEVYFRAGKPIEFQEIAKGLKPKLSNSEWTKLALMGKQLSPDAALFQGIDAGALATDMDLAFDEPTVAVTSTPTPRARPRPDDPLEFDLNSLEVPKLEVPAAPTSKDVGNALEFNLDDFKLDVPSTPSTPAPVAKAAEPSEPSLEFDLSGFDLDTPKSTAATSDAHAISVDDIKLDDFDLGASDDSHAISTGDEASTKLDLARAYVDMGDNDSARGLLNEVLQQGSDTQKKEAQTLLSRLG